MTVHSWLWVALFALLLAGSARTYELIQAYKDWMVTLGVDDGRMAERLRVAAWMLMRIAFESVMRVALAGTAVIWALIVGYDERLAPLEQAELEALALVLALCAICLVDVLSTLMGRVYRKHMSSLGNGFTESG
jgi:hypothetical protein